MGFWGQHHKRSRQYRKRERRQRDDSVQWNFLADRLEEPCIRKLLRVHRGRGRGHCVSAPASHIRHTPYRPADNACLDSTKSSPELTSRSSGRPIESDVLVPTVASCPREQRPRRSLQIHPGKSRWGFEPGLELSTASVMSPFRQWPLCGGRSWWAHYRCTLISIELTFLPEKAEDLMGILDSATFSGDYHQATSPGHDPAVSGRR